MSSACYGGAPWALCACLALGGLALGGAARAEVPAPRIAYSIDAKPLDQALAEYSAHSGLTVLVDSALTAGIAAPAVKGLYTAGDALRKLLAGSGLSIRYASAHSFTLVAASEALRPAAPARGMALRDTGYAARLQATLRRVLCAASGTAPGSYRALVQLWFDSAWRVERVTWIGGTGQPALDARLDAALRGASAGPLPPGMAQPITVLVTPRDAPECVAATGNPHAR